MPLVRFARRAVILIVFIALLAFGARRLYVALAPRTIRVCVVSDYTFRLERPDWEYRLKLWFAEVNRIFEPSGVQWSSVNGGEAYSEKIGGTLAERRALIEDTVSCDADLVLGLTGGPDRGSKFSAAPFARTLLVATTAADSDEVVIERLARSFATLFASPVSADEIVATNRPNGDVLDPAAVALIREFRQYDFRHGAAALRGAWEERAIKALIPALTGTTRQPAREAHRILARAFASARLYPEAVAHMREAVRYDPRDAFLRMELALTLRNDSQNDAALEELKRAAALDPDDARPHALMGTIYRDQLRAYDAIHQYRLATQLDPSTPEYFAALGSALSMQVGKTNEAATAFQTALRLKSHVPQAIAGLDQVGLTQVNAKQDLVDAQAAAGAAPQSVEIQIWLAYAHMQAGNTEAAKRALERAAAIDPRNGQIHVALSRVSFDKGDYTAAERELEAARVLGARIPPAFESALKRRLGPTQAASR